MLTDYQDLMKPLFTKLGLGFENTGFLTSSQATPITLQNLLSVESGVAENHVARLHRSAMQALEADILSHIYAQTPKFFENLIVDLLLAMGYGSRRRDLSRRLGQSHDGGVDGLISQDELGLEVILIQAKRLKPNSNVSVSQVRDFAGSLESRRASKGVFVTTGNFTIPARMIVQELSRRIVLINGKELAALMVRHNLGAKTTETYVFKALDLNYFSSETR